MTMTSFVVTLYGQCCLRHVVGQRVVSHVSVVRSCQSKLSVACVLDRKSCTEWHNSTRRRVDL